MPFKEHNAPSPRCREIDPRCWPLPNTSSHTSALAFSLSSRPFLRSVYPSFAKVIVLYSICLSVRIWWELFLLVFFLFNDVTLSVPRYIGLIVTMVYLVRLYEEGECQRLTMPVQCDCITSQAQTPFFKFSRFSK